MIWTPGGYSSFSDILEIKQIKCFGNNWTKPHPGISTSREGWQRRSDNVSRGSKEVPKAKYELRLKFSRSYVFQLAK